MAITKEKIEIELYNILLNKTEYPKKYAVQSFPDIEKEDTIRGWINRYFLRQSNNKFANIIEVNESDFNQYKNDPFYKNIKIRWKIIGNKEHIFNYNLKEINDADKEMPGIKSKLENKLLEYESNDFI